MGENLFSGLGFGGESASVVGGGGGASGAGGSFGVVRRTKLRMCDQVPYKCLRLDGPSRILAC